MAKRQRKKTTSAAPALPSNEAPSRPVSEKANNPDVTPYAPRSAPDKDEPIRPADPMPDQSKFMKTRSGPSPARMRAESAKRTEPQAAAPVESKPETPKAEPPKPAPVVASNVQFITIKIPVSTVQPTGFIRSGISIKGLSGSQRLALRQLGEGLQSEAVILSNGKHVRDWGDGVRFILEQIADAMA